MKAKLKQGLVHIYTGGGKGKTTAAFGLAMRAIGAGHRVCIFQFLKGGKFSSGEEKAMKLFCRSLKFIKFEGRHPIFWKFKDRSDKINKLKILKAALRKDLAQARRASESERYDLIILDEVINAVSSGLIGEDEIINLIESKPESVEIVLTGRGATKRLIEKADYFTEMKEVKHPYSRGVTARRGIEF